jgi:hypothetical protein
MHTLLTTTVVLAVATSVSAECTIPPPPCEALARSSIVFVGEAIAAGPFEQNFGPNRYQLIDQSVRFRVIEQFKGIAKAQKEVAASIAFQIDNVLFVAGPRYLVYATVGSDGKWYTGCSRTGTLERRFDDVRQLRSCKGANRP